MTNKTLFLTVDNLKLDLKNPRFNGVEFKNESEAIDQLFELFDNTRFLNLAEDMLASGLNPSETFLIMRDEPNDKKYTVLEGNRRLTCLILLSNPEKSPTPSIESRIKKILTKYPDNSPQKIVITCSLMSSREEADKWIDLKHADTNKKGLKTEEWPSNTRALRGSSKERPELYFQLIEILKDNSIVPSLIINIITSLRRTNITRLFGFAAVRTLLNYTFTEGIIELSPDKDTQNETLKNISKVLLHIYNQKLGVSSFKNAKQAEELIRSILQENTISLVDGRLVISDDFKHLNSEFDLNDEPDNNQDDEPDNNQNDGPDNNQDDEPDNNQDDEPDSNQDDEPDSNQNDEPDSNQNDGPDNNQDDEPDNNQNDEPDNNQEDKPNEKPTVSSPSYLNQKCLINYTLNISEKKINQIYRELKRMPLDDYLYSVSITFRAFLELSCDWYIYKQKNSKVTYRYPKEGSDREVGEGSQLSKKLDGIAHHFHNIGLLDKKQLEAAKLIADETGTGTINWLHSCVHNYTKLIIKSDILAIQNDLRPFLESIWNK